MLTKNAGSATASLQYMQNIKMHNEWMKKISSHWNEIDKAQNFKIQNFRHCNGAIEYFHQQKRIDPYRQHEINIWKTNKDERKLRTQIPTTFARGGIEYLREKRKDGFLRSEVGSNQETARKKL